MRMHEFCDLVEREPIGYRDTEIRQFSNDSRKLQSGDVFVAIKTAVGDGNRFLPHAREQGAVGYLASRVPGEPDGYENFFLTQDPLRLMGAAAGRLVQSRARQRVGITGSVGKTTTKQLLTAILSARLRAACSEGNYNNTIGLPLTILNRLTGSVDAYVSEMGMSTPGEIARMVAMVRPQYRVWLNVMPAHAGNFGSIEAIRDAKAEILDQRDMDDVVIFNADDILVKNRVVQSPGVWYAFGHGESCDMRIRSSRVLSLEQGELSVSYHGRTYSFRHHLPGDHWAGTIAAALLVAALLGVEPEQAAGPLADFRPVARRGEVRRLGPVTVVDDCYNASPQAVKAALKLLADAPVPGRRIAVLGDMLELGEQSVMLHRDVGRAINRLPLDRVVLFGPEMAAAAKELRIPSDWVETNEAAAALTCEIVGPRDTVLVKASRGMHAEVVVDAMREKWA